MSNAVEETYFSKVANEILQSAEQIANRMEDGISVLLTGKLPNNLDKLSGNQEAKQNTFHMDDENDNIEFEDEDVAELLKNSPLQGMAEQVLDGIMSKQATPQTPLEHFHAFRSAINWTEPFVMSIIAFQVLAFLATLWVSRRHRSLAPRIIMMVVIAGIVKSSEYLNRLGNKHWEKFATQNYFDKQGIFMLIMVCGPLLFNSFIMLISYLREASQLLIQVKTNQLKRQKKLEKSTAASSKTTDDKRTPAKKRRSKKED